MWCTSHHLPATRSNRTTLQPAQNRSRLGNHPNTLFIKGVPNGLPSRLESLASMKRLSAKQLRKPGVACLSDQLLLVAFLLAQSARNMATATSKEPHAPNMRLNVHVLAGQVLITKQHVSSAPKTSPPDTVLASSSESDFADPCLSQATPQASTKRPRQSEPISGLHDADGSAPT